VKVAAPPARSLKVSMCPASSREMTPVATLAITVARRFLRSSSVPSDSERARVRAATMASRFRL